MGPNKNYGRLKKWGTRKEISFAVSTKTIVASVRTIVYNLLRNFTALTVKLSISTKSKFLHFWTRLFIWNLNPFQTVFAIMRPLNEDQSTPRQIIRGCVFMLVIRWYLMSVCECVCVCVCVCACVYACVHGSSRETRRKCEREVRS